MARGQRHRHGDWQPGIPNRSRSRRGPKILSSGNVLMEVDWRIMNTLKTGLDTRGKEAINRRAAFTLLELVVVIVALSLLAATVLPSLNNGGSQMLAVECLNHHRQLCAAWRMYAEDNSQKLVPNITGPGALGGAAGAAAWASGWLDWSTSPDNTNVAFLINPKYARLASYVNG